MTTSSRLNAQRYVRRSLRFHWRVNLAVMLGVIAGTAVLTGALIVGDSVHDSLRRLTLERLGRIDEVVLANHFFSTELAKKIESAQQSQANEPSLATFPQIVPVILLSRITVEKPGDEVRRAGQVTVVGCDDDFWDLSDVKTRPRSSPRGRQIVLNQTLADDLDASVGDHLVVRLPKASRIAGDSPLGEKSDRVENLAELEVIEILPSNGLARFSLHANQALPRAAFLDVKSLQQALGQSGKVNAILLAGRVASQAPSDAQVTDLRKQIRPTLADAGLQLKRVSLDYWPPESDQPSSAFQYLSLSTDTMMFAPTAEQAVEGALTGIEHQTVLTYLANSISAVSESANESANDATAEAIPYSTVTALNSDPGLTPLVSSDGYPMAPLADDQIVLNQWAATDLGVHPGDRIRLAYFAPETTHGEAKEEAHELTLTAILPLQQPESPYTREQPARYTQPPSRANDPDLTPEVPGITDQDSIDAWDPPFPFDQRRIRQPQDEEYWDAYRTTPKAFVSKRVGESLWGSRFGKTTSFRIVSSDTTSRLEVERRLTNAVAENLEAFGFALLHVKQDGLRASRGTTPFNVLFLGFSFFIIAAALMLVCLLFQLSLERRASEAGLLLALGLDQRQVSRLFLREGLLISLLGVVVGTLLGIGYAALMIAGLRTWWLSAVVTPFLRLHVGPFTLPIGALLGAVASLLTIRWTIRSLQKSSLQGLLSGNFEPTKGATRKGRTTPTYVAGALWIVSITAGIAAVFLRGEAQAGAFFAAGASVLVAMLLQVSAWLKRPVAVKNLRRHGFSLTQMIMRNLGRNAGRSTLTIGLMATACFLIVAISAFRLSPTEQGTGGFQWLAQSDVPIFEDLNDQQVRNDLWGSEAERLKGTTVLSLRMQDGDDASCRNLYQAGRPRVLGVTPRFVQYFNGPDVTSFGWAGSAAESPQQQANPWQLLTEKPSDPIPVILDKNTAMYSLHLYGGVGEEFELDYGSTVGKLRFKVVGLLTNSVLQGSLMMSEANVVDHFPDVSGYRFFLVHTSGGQTSEVRPLLEGAFRDEGFQASSAEQLLSDLLAVQNTYLSTFQSLGGLGLLLGTFGLIAVQLRNVFERRGELALLRASGFSQRRLGQLVLMEHLALLLGGLGIGVIAALVSVLPHAWTTQVRPPWATLFGVLSSILVVGIVSGYLALRPIARAPIMSALRGD